MKPHTNEWQKADRDAEVAAVYRRLNATMDYLPGETGREHYQRVIEAVSRSRASAYYLTYEYALRRLSEIRRRKRACSSRRRGLWAELEQRVCFEIKRNGVNAGDALAAVLAQGDASSFFLSPSGIRKAIYCHYRRKRG